VYNTETSNPDGFEPTSPLLKVLDCFQVQVKKAIRITCLCSPYTLSPGPVTPRAADPSSCTKKTKLWEHDMVMQAHERHLEGRVLAKK